jgi:hypothetical protein
MISARKAFIVSLLTSVRGFSGSRPGSTGSLAEHERDAIDRFP